MLFCWCLVGRAADVISRFLQPPPSKVLLWLSRCPRWHGCGLCCYVLVLFACFSLCCLLPRDFAPNRAFPGVFTRLKRSLPCTKAPERCLNPHLPELAPRQQHKQCSHTRTDCLYITTSQCSAPLWPSRWPPACNRSRRRGSWQQRQPLSQCSHSAPIRRCTRPSPRRPSSNDPAWYRHFKLTRAPRVATRPHESPRVSRESSFATVPHAGSRRRRIE